MKKLSFWGGYNLSKWRNTDSGSSGSPFDAYDFSQEFARGPWGSLNFVYGGGSYTAPGEISLNLFVVGNTGYPFNITTGRDANGDTFFSEQPAFATDLNEPGVVVTPLGAFDQHLRRDKQLFRETSDVVQVSCLLTSGSAEQSNSEKRSNQKHHHQPAPRALQLRARIKNHRRSLRSNDRIPSRST